MRFVQNVMQEITESVPEPDKDQENENEEASEPPQVLDNELFIDYLKEQNLSEKLQSFILYIICLCSSVTEANAISKKEGMNRVYRYQESSGVYGGTPFLYPLYGISEITQGYSRLAAVNSTIFILKRSIDSLVVDEETGTVKGVLCNAGQFLEAPVFVTAPRYFPDAVSHSLASRFIAITDKSLHPEHSLLQMVIPAGEREKTIFASQLDATTFVCPANKYVLQLSCDSNESPQDDLKPLADELLQTTEDGSDKPKSIFQAYYSLVDYTLSQDSVPAGTFLTSEFPRSAVGFDLYLEAAEKIFHQIVGDDYDFYPRRPDPNERFNNVEEEIQDVE